MISGILQSYSANKPIADANSNQSNSNTNNIFKTNSSNNNKEIDHKIDQLTKIVESVSYENQKLKPMLKSVADMQYYTFQKLKSYEASMEELKKKLNVMNNHNNLINSDIGHSETISTKVEKQIINQNINNNKNNKLFNDNNNQMKFRFVEP